MIYFHNGADFVKRGDFEYLVTASSLGRIFDSKIYINQIEEKRNGKIKKESVGFFSLPPMAEEVCTFEDTDGVIKLAIGNESFSKRYEIERRSISPTAITIMDFDKILEIKKREKISKGPNIIRNIDVAMPKKKREDGVEIVEDDHERE